MGGPVFVAIGNFIGAVFGFGEAVTGWYWFSVQVARLATLALASKLLTPSPDLSFAAREKMRTLRDSIHPQRFVYGEDMLSGPIIFGQVRGAEAEFMTIAIALTGHEIDSFQAYRLDDTDIALTDLSGAYSGDVTNGKFANVANVNALLGNQTQNCAASLSSGYSTLFGATTHRGLGHSYMVWEFELVEESTAYETGAPQNLRALVRGKKIYDPRLDSTNGGTGTHRLATPSTWEWSDNPALCLADFIRDEKFGMKEDDSRIDWALVIAAADICDANVSIPGGTQKRYTCNATFEATEQRGSVRDALLNAMLGRMVFTQGVWKMWAGAALAATVTLNETNLSGSIQVQASAGSKERYNRVRGKFIDPSRNYTASTYPELRSSAYETEDGNEVRILTADFLATNNDYEAQRKGIITLKQSRQQRIVQFTGNLSCFRVQPGTTIELDIAEYGFSGEKFFVSEWAMGESGIELTMVEEVDASWDAPLVGEYITRTATGVIQYGDLGVPPPSSVSAFASTDAIYLQWTNPPPTTYASIEIWGSDDNVRGNAVLLATVTGNEYYDQLGGNRTRFYWLRAINSIGVRSAWEPDLTTTTITETSLGTTGTDGNSSIVALVYIRSASAPTTPSVNDGEYNFTTQTLTPPTSWSATPPASDGNPLYVSSGIFEIPGISGTDSTVVWSAPALMVSDGIQGPSGQNSATVNLFHKNTSAVTPPATFSGTFTYTFATAALSGGTLNGWSQTAPDIVAGEYLWIRQAAAVSATTTDTIAAAEFSGGVVIGIGGSDGGAGLDGLNNAIAYLYHKNTSSVTPPTLFSGTWTYTFATAALSGGTLNGWAQSAPDIGPGEFLWLSQASASSITSTDSIPTGEFSTPVVIALGGSDGGTGPSGQNSATVNLFNKNTSAVTPPATFSGTFTYTFATAALSGGTLNGWSQSAPDIVAGEYLWIRQAAAVSALTTDTIAAAEFSGGVVVGIGGEDGGAGLDGLNNATAYLFHKNTSSVTPPTLFSGTWTYTFATAALSGGTFNGWAQSAPDIVAGEFLWLSQASASSTTSTDSIPTGEFSTPVVIGVGGSDGGDGNSVFYASQYRRAATQPATPTGGSYNFTSKTLTPSTNWSATPPDIDGNPLWISNSIAEINGTTGTDSTLTWSTPAELVSDGVDANRLVYDEQVSLGASNWDVSDGNASYSVGAGIFGDALLLSPDSLGAEVYTAERRGPIIYDLTASRATVIEIRWRVKLDVQPGGTWNGAPSARIVTSDVNGNNRNFYTKVGAVEFDNTSTADVWFDDVTTIEVPDTDTPPRYIQVGFVISANAFNPTYAIDFVQASFVGVVFTGINTIGFVPDPISATGKYLKDNGTWDTPPTGGAEVNDLTAAVTWTNIPIANVPTGTTGTTVALGNHLHAGVYEPAFSKNTAFNDNYGTASGTVAAGNHLHSGVYDNYSNWTVRADSGIDYFISSAEVLDIAGGSGIQTATASGSVTVTLGTPTSITDTSSNSAGTGHTHAVSHTGTGIFAMQASPTFTGTLSAATVAATTVTGANVTSGANPGHTHTGSSISALDAGDITTGTLAVLRGGTGTTTVTGTGSVVRRNAPVFLGAVSLPVTTFVTGEGAILYYDDATYTGGKITVSASAPVTPTKGDIWFDTT